MKIAVLFDGAGLARLGLEQAGHECTGYEIDPSKHILSRLTGSGNCILEDATSVDLSEYDAVWASPPCQAYSMANKTDHYISKYGGDYLKWCLDLPHSILWVENVVTPFARWGRLYNAAQFTKEPLQCRNRMIGGRYSLPKVYCRYSRTWPNICKAIVATEWKQRKRGAYDYLGHVPSIEECAHFQGLEIPFKWYDVPEGYTKAQWKRNLYEAIGNGVPVYMAKAFGEVYG